jgi:aryl-alcohol dehydrogenase-like predicted oxidoreductase
VIADKHNATVAQTALNYLLRKPAVSSVIIGANKPEQLDDNLKSVDWVMTPEEVARLDELSKPARPYPHWMHDIVRHDRAVAKMRGD